MSKLHSKFTIIATATIAIATAFSPLAVRAADIPAASAQIGDWQISTLAHDGAEWKIEAYKVDRGLAAWTELSVSGAKRRLYAYDGVKTTLLAEMPISDWSNKEPYFVEDVTGQFDAADGIVTWTMNDGADREIYFFDGESVKKVSDNTYDDRHPITAGGRVAWTSQPTASQYNLMVREPNGAIKRLASWNVTNYAFSGSTLYWMSITPPETWFRVFRNDGKTTMAVGKGDDRPMTKYFFTDGKGSAAWEFSTKDWTYDHRETFVSYHGQPALRLIERYVPPQETRLEDMDDGKVILNDFDWQYRRITDRNSLIEVMGGYEEKTIEQKEIMVKVRFMDGGYVAQREPSANIGLYFQRPDGQDYITLDPVIADLFDADGATAAGAKVGGGVVLFSRGKSQDIASQSETTGLKVKNGDVIWVEGSGNGRTLKFAGQTVLVKTAYGVKRSGGHLVKAADGKAVYLASEDGRRYVFPGVLQFNDWYDGFSSVRTVSATALAKMPLAGDVLFRGGDRMIKARSSNRVYAVSTDGTIHALANEDAAKQIFGDDWKTKITVVGDGQLADYQVGASVTDLLNWYATLAKRTVVR